MTKAELIEAWQEATGLGDEAEEHRHVSKLKGGSMDIVRTNVEIARVENWAFEGAYKGSKYPDMNYEQGIIDILNWLRGDDDHAPDEED